MKELICLIGPSGAGKSTAGHILEKKYGYTYITASKYIQELKTDIEAVTGYSYDLNELIAAVSAEMPKGFNEYVEHVFLKNNSDRIVWDSCINTSHLDTVLKHFEKVYFLCFNVPYARRIQRVLERGSLGPNVSFDIAKRKIYLVDLYERALGMGDLMALADWTIVADSLSGLDAELSHFIDQCRPTSVEEKIKACNDHFIIPAKEALITTPLMQYLKKKGVPL